jgi:hypothetical protein
MARFALSLTSTMILTLVTATSVAAQNPLPLGAPQTGKLASGGAAEYAVDAKTAGIITAVVNGEADLVLQIVDADGQALPDGRSDRDLNGAVGTEVVSVIVPEPGAYRVRVTANGNEAASFEIAGAWVSFPVFLRANPDPDRRPGNAIAAEIGKAIEDSLDAKAGDNWDWFVLSPAQGGALAIVTRRVGSGEADLRLEAYLDGNFSEAAEESDADLQGDSANESLIVNVKPGQRVHVRVSRVFSEGTTRYTLSSNLVP